VSDFEIANISGTVSKTENGLRIYIDGSGPFMQRPWRRNDWFRTNFLAVVTVGVHLGYLIAAIRVVVHFRNDIKEAGSLYISGISLGGAVAEVAALIASCMLPRSGVIYKSAGGPAPWWIITSPVFWLIYRLRDVSGLWFVAGSDPVPRIPPWNVHIGQRVRLPSVGDPIRNHIHGYDRLRLR
jgi:hypothetical protein